MLIGPLYVIVICSRNNLKFSRMCVKNLRNSFRPGMPVKYKDSLKSPIGIFVNYSLLLPVCIRIVLFHNTMVPCSECIFMTVGCKVVRPCTVEQSAQCSTSCPQPMY